jgi:hypothetical protein
VAELSSPHERRASWPDRVVPPLEALARNPLIAYPLIVLLELRFMWRVWDYKDTDAGDTAGYYLYALRWAQHLGDEIVWSPLYTDYYGTIVKLVHDLPTAVMLHRLLIVFAAALLVLAVARALLGPALGLLVATWWCLVPANFDVDYEVHLFSFLPVLVAALIVARAPSRTRLGLALAILAGATALLRNELIFATVIFAAGILIAEWRGRRESPPSVRVCARAYGLPLAVVALLIAGAVWQSPAHGAHTRDLLDSKHRLNMCQIYAFNYQQRHPADFQGNPFTKCAPLMQRVFGRPMPTFVEEVKANPHAVAEFLAWNVKLIPNGLQVALFGATSRGDNPGYFTIKLYRRYAAILTLVALVIVVAGLLAMWRDRRFWLARARERKWILLVLLGASATALFAALTQRPRSDYIFALTLGLMLLTAACAGALARLARVERIAAAGAVLVPVILIFALPSYFHRGPTPMRDALERLDKFAPELQRRNAVLITSGYNFEICAYFARSMTSYCNAPYWADFQPRIAKTQSVRRALDDVHATIVYADPVSRLDPRFRAFAESPPREWTTVESGRGDDGDWSVLVRRTG